MLEKRPKTRRRLARIRGLESLYAELEQTLIFILASAAVALVLTSIMSVVISGEHIPLPPSPMLVILATSLIIGQRVYLLNLKTNIGIFIFLIAAGAEFIFLPISSIPVSLFTYLYISINTVTYFFLVFVLCLMISLAKLKPFTDVEKKYIDYIVIFCVGSSLLLAAISSELGRSVFVLKAQLLLGAAGLGVRMAKTSYEIAELKSASRTIAPPSGT